MDSKCPPELGSTNEYADDRGRVTLWHIAPGVLCARSYGHVDGPIVDRLFMHADEIFAGLPGDAKQEIFFDHRRLTGWTLANFKVSMKWYRRQRHEVLVCHMLTGEIPGVMRLALLLSRPFTPEGFEKHPTVAGFEAALAARRA